MVNKIVMWFLEINKTLSKYQAGFRPNYNPNNHLTLLASNIAERFRQKLDTIVVYLDMEKAYERIHIECSPFPNGHRLDNPYFWPTDPQSPKDMAL